MENRTTSSYRDVMFDMPSYMSNMTTIKSFPHVSSSEFEAACAELVKGFQLHGKNQKDWLSIEIIDRSDVKYARVTKPLLSIQNNNTEDTTPFPEELEEPETQDDEELIPTNHAPQVVIEYDIILSPSYQVPVLYFSIKDPGFKFPSTMENLYQHIIPPSYKEEAKSAGVLGGITIADHPHTNLPVFFIHPCQTSAVMEVSTGSRPVTPYEYLVLWIGALGHYVGLDVPLDLGVRSVVDHNSNEV